ncbi:MAG: histidine--tRNA ligase, partial [Chloroflexota bacterium]|nr:histidine--tRNA ligase [Chloroflexota bacterium]
MTTTAPRKPQILKGFRDYLPKTMLTRQRVIATFRDIFERHGFEPIDTPALEYLEVLTGKAGENERLMYHFVDQGGREIGLRYDLTVPLARVVAMHQNDLVLPFKRYHIAPVWRAEKPQRGRFREFWQCDADIVGVSTALADAEIVGIMAETLAAVGLGNAVIHINHRRLLEAVARFAGVGEERSSTLFRAIDKLDKIGVDAVSRELTNDGVSSEAVERVLSIVSLRGTPSDLLDDLDERLCEDPLAVGAIWDLRELFLNLEAMNIPPARYDFDLALARGLDYYTGPVFEAVVDEPKIGSVAGAGRYDELIGTFLGRTIPATGMSLGVERIVDVIEEFGLMPSPQSVAELFVAVFPDTISASMGIAHQLREGGIRVDLGLQPNRSLGEQLKYA